MASSPVPAKSQPLHYFSLPPQWKWNNKNHHHSNNHHHRCRSRFSDRQSPPTDADRRQSQAPPRSHISDSGYAAAPIKHFAPSGFSLPSDQKSEMKSTVANAEGKESRSNSKIYIRLPKKKRDDLIEEGKASCSVEGEAEECQESLPKTWNLRPRRPLHKQSNGNGGTGTHKIGVLTIQENKSRSPLHQNWPDLEVNAIEKKQKFSISLSREEIEEDIFALTLSKPSRRPKKRPRVVQKQLDNLFPGLWLDTITPDSYKVSDGPPKV